MLAETDIQDNNVEICPTQQTVQKTIMSGDVQDDSLCRMQQCLDMYKMADYIEGINTWRCPKQCYLLYCSITRQLTIDTHSSFDGWRICLSSMASIQYHGVDYGPTMDFFPLPQTFISTI
ncbi:hypothetical protein CDAR_320861 [Caerostris darwini]|uniref:ShKT domain-containing protein n=1 Tax=Caerostris darwini TaxID=1538125 RepID=A0AAV4WYA6_9ARAC|nr:hypothetical protein CDAR_320861 [Caerostris darwini]